MHATPHMQTRTHTSSRTYLVFGDFRVCIDTHTRAYTRKHTHSLSHSLTLTLTPPPPFLLQASYMVLDQKISPVTFSVGNTMKRVAVVASSVLFFKNPVSGEEHLGRS